jgi:hypothetical protein
MLKSMYEQLKNNNIHLVTLLHTQSDEVIENVMKYLTINDVHRMHYGYDMSEHQVCINVKHVSRNHTAYLFAHKNDIVTDVAATMLSLFYASDSRAYNVYKHNATASISSILECIDNILYR